MNKEHSAIFSEFRNLDALPVGTVISSSRGPYRHVGVLTERGRYPERQVISLNPGPSGCQVIEEPVSAFTRGQPFEVSLRACAIPPWAVLARARSGAHPAYSWLTFNCEHFVSYALGDPIRSPQLAAWTLLATTALVLSRG